MQGIRHGLCSIQVRASRLQLRVTRQPMDIGQALQAQRLNHRK